MNSLTDGLLQPIDADTYSGILDRINLSDVEIPSV